MLLLLSNIAAQLRIVLVQQEIAEMSCCSGPDIPVCRRNLPKYCTSRCVSLTSVDNGFRANGELIVPSTVLKCRDKVCNCVS